MLNENNKNKISLQEFKKTIKIYYPDIRIIDNTSMCGDGEIYLYKGSKNVKFPLFVKGSKVVVKYVGECYIPDNEFSNIFGNVHIYTVDVNLRYSDIIYEVISKKEYLKIQNDINTKEIWIGNKQVYLKRIHLFGIDTNHYVTIQNYFNY